MAEPRLHAAEDKGITANIRAFRVLVRNALFRRVELAAHERWEALGELDGASARDRKSTRLNSSHVAISYAVFCLKKKNKTYTATRDKHGILEPQKTTMG